MKKAISLVKKQAKIVKILIKNSENFNKKQQKNYVFLIKNSKKL